MATRYWFVFETDPSISYPPGTKIGCGVTAYNLNHAKNILETMVFKNQLPKIKEVRANIDVNTLDLGHVILNMGPPNRIGVWFPLGYQ